MNFRSLVVPLLLVLASVSFATASLAAEAIIPAPPQLSATGYILLDADTGQVMVESNSNQKLPPASLTKMMTSYVAAGEIKKGSLKLDDQVNVSVNAWRSEGSRMFIREGTQVPVSDLLKGIVIQSGNDASVAIAEHIAGSEGVFADIMNQHAKQLGMTGTHFMNATGLPDPEHYTTAHDLGLLAIALIRDFPEHYAMYREKYFTYNDIRQPNRNSLLWRDATVDGVKTGHTEAAGYCLVASALRDNMRLVAVVMGTGSEEARATESQKLLTYGFRYYETLHLYAAGEVLRNVRVWRGAQREVALGLNHAVVVTAPRGLRENLSASMDIGRVIRAPFAAGDELGRLIVSSGDTVVYEGPMVALSEVSEAGFFARIWDAISLFFLQFFGGDPLAL